jgi:archaeosine synthase beta-subunit
LRAARSPRLPSPAVGEPHGALLEEEILPDGRRGPIVTVYLRNGACPLACAYCGLYRFADDRAATGEEIARQIRHVRECFPRARALKLYNASSLFEPASIVQRDLGRIAAELADLDLVVVEARAENAHRAIPFARRIAAPLEVAIGLDVADDELLRRLNKPSSVAAFRAAARRLRTAGIHLRVFVLIQPPFVAEREAGSLARSAVAEARDAGARVVSLLPVRSSHRPLERLTTGGFWAPPSLETVYDTVASCLGSETIVLVEEDGLDGLTGCERCAPRRRRALVALNRSGDLAAVPCTNHRRPRAFVPRAYSADAVLAVLQ